MASGKIHPFAPHPAPLGQIPYKPTGSVSVQDQSAFGGPAPKQPHVDESQFGGPAVAGSGVGAGGLGPAQQQTNIPGTQAPKAPQVEDGFLTHVGRAAKRVPWWVWLTVAVGGGYVVYRKKNGKPIAPWGGGKAKKNPKGDEDAS